MQEVNNRVLELLSEMSSEDAEFVCECSDKDCIETIPFTLGEYAALLAQPVRPPLKLPTHPG